MDLRQVANRSKCDPATSSYDVIAFLMSPGQAPRLYAEVANRLEVPPGGQLLIVDSIPLHGKWYHSATNSYLSLKSMVAGAKPSAGIVDDLEAKTTHVAKKEMVFGVYPFISASAAGGG